MAYDTPTPRGIRKPLKSELAQLARLFAENADDTDAALDDLEADILAAVSGTYSPVGHTHGSTGFRGVRADAASQSVATGTITVMAMASETFDTDGFHDNATNNNRLTVPAGLAGYYRVTATIDFSDSAATTGIRGVYLRKNGSIVNSTLHSKSATGTHKQQCTLDVELAEGDYVEMAAYHTHGSTLTLVFGFLTAHYLGA